MSKPEAILFDVFGTLLDVKGGIIAEGRRLARENADAIDWPGVAEAWTRAYGCAMASPGVWRPLDEILAGALRWIAPRFGLQDRMGRYPFDDLLSAWSRLTLWPDAEQGLARLRDRYTLAAFSNASHAMLRSIAGGNGFPWDVHLSADEARAFKPDPAIYRMALRELALPPESVLLVAAHTFDLNAANKHGIRTALIERECESGSDPKGLDHVAEMLAPDVNSLANWLLE